MTAPPVQFGNIASDIGQGANSLIQGLVSQRQRQQQIAMQQALASSKEQQEQAQTQDIQQQTSEREYNNQPAGNVEYNILQQAYPHLTLPQLQSSGIRRGEALELAHSGLMLQRLGLTQDRFDEGRMLTELQQFKNDPEVKNALGVAAVYRNSKTLLRTGAPITTPSLLLDLGQTLGMPGQPNARAVGTELANLLRGEGLSYTQRAQQFINKLVTEGDNFTLDPETVRAIPEIIRSVATARMHRYDQLRGDLKARNQVILGRPLPDEAIGVDPYGDIRQELSGVPSPAAPAKQHGISLPGVDR